MAGTWRRWWWRDAVVRGVVVVACIVLIIVCLPRAERPEYDYTVNQPWTYASLIADNEFSVFKDRERVTAERDSLISHRSPYYELDPTVEERMVSSLAAAFPDGLPSLPSDYLSELIRRLHRIYQARVMDSEEYARYCGDTLSTIRLITGTEVHVLGGQYIYSTRAAYLQLLADEEGDAATRQVLRGLNLNAFIVPNIKYDSARNTQDSIALSKSVATSDGKVYKGEKIVDKGQIVTPEIARRIRSFEEDRNRHAPGERAIRYTLLGHIIYVSVLVLLFTLYLYLYRRDYFNRPRAMTMLYVLLAVFPILTSFLIQHHLLSVYIVPFCIGPIFVRVFMDSRTAFFAHVCTILLSAVVVSYQYEFIIIQLVAGTVAIFSLRALSKRSDLVRAALYLGIASAVIYYSLQLIASDGTSPLDAKLYYHFAINAGLTLIAYPLMYIVERLFNFTSDVVLFELSNSTQGLLRQLSEVAPGTFQHSVSVANLAREVANKINANSLLVHTGGLYHDIGKMENPVFFVENQQGVSPHDKMTYAQSAAIIIGHVQKGYAMAERAGLPQFIKDFILTHHGTGKAKYFYIMEKNAHPDVAVDESVFTYPGPNPYTKEQAILMMADATEAAARALKEYTEESITALVNGIIDSQVQEGFFVACPITFQDIATAKGVFIERLKIIYHTRISYPTLTAAGAEPSSSAPSSEQ